MPFKLRERKRAYSLEYDRSKRYIYLREKAWRQQGIRSASDPRRALEWAEFTAVLWFQKLRCGLCHGAFLLGTPCADHNHTTGIFRGAIHVDENQFALSVYERYGRFKSPARADLMREYLEASPAQQWIAAGRPPAPTIRENRLASAYPGQGASRRAGGAAAAALAPDA